MLQLLIAFYVFSLVLVKIFSLGKAGDNTNQLNNKMTSVIKCDNFGDECKARNWDSLYLYEF